MIAPADDPVVRARLLHLPGYDLQQALRNVGGKHSALLRLLDRFVEMYAAGLPSLQQAPQESLRTVWREDAHALRGVCATLGARALEHDLLKFETALHDGAELDTLAQEARTLHAQVQAWATALSRALHG